MKCSYKLPEERIIQYFPRLQRVIVGLGGSRVFVNTHVKCLAPVCLRFISIQLNQNMQKYNYAKFCAVCLASFCKDGIETLINDAFKQLNIKSYLMHSGFHKNSGYAPV